MISAALCGNFPSMIHRSLLSMSMPWPGLMLYLLNLPKLMELPILASWNATVQYNIKIMKFSRGIENRFFGSATEKKY
jgi:hypothetical protein